MTNHITSSSHVTTIITMLTADWLCREEQQFLAAISDSGTNILHLGKLGAEARA